MDTGFRNSVHSICAYNACFFVCLFFVRFDLSNVSSQTHPWDYSPKEDSHSLHRYKADRAYVVGVESTPVGAYLNADDMVRIAVEHGVDAIHPGYGFLSENAVFARKCAAAGVTFIGPSPEVLELFGDKTKARNLALENNVAVIPGTETPCHGVEDARRFIEKIGYPVMLKAVNGGGGRGMRVCRRAEDLASAYQSASDEALLAFGDGSMFVEKLVERPMHVEVQIIGDGTDHVHLFERDCSVQRRHQKIVEVAPSLGISDVTRQAIFRDALRLAQASKYKNAGTVEFLIDQKGNHYFIEVNPRIQVEHTVTEEITGIDIVQTQIRVAEGHSLASLGLEQSKISQRGFAVQARVTTENPSEGFAPDYGRLDVFRAAEGMGIRLDAASGFTGATITPHYDSLLSKVTAHALTFDLACAKLARALVEFRVRGVHTNVPFIVNVLKHPEFRKGMARTDFIETHKELFDFPPLRDRANKLLRYLGEVVVNGHPMPGADKTKVSASLPAPIPPALGINTPAPFGWRNVLQKLGPEGFARAIRQHPKPLFGDTTWRDAHQSLFATRMRTLDMKNIAQHTSHAMAGLFALEMWGGATFDVALRFLRESPWDRLEELRELVPNIPFQMLLRGANAVGYTSYPDNVVHAFCKQSVKSGMDVFRVFDSLNYVPNLLLGMEAVHAAGGVVQGEICYTGDVSDPNNSKYNLDYYMKLADEIITKGHSHILGIKDMAGLLKPNAATLLVSALRKEFPKTPIHVHTHDTAGIGVASMVAAVQAGADVVHGALDSMSGTTSQPSLGALVASLQSPSSKATVYHPVPDLKLESLFPLNDYWAVVRTKYAPFEQTVASGSTDVFEHQMPGGQYTNLMFQAQEMGLASQWPAVKRAYVEANKALGDIVKVTPSSKVVGDLAQFMVTNKIQTAAQLVDAAGTLDFPSSVVEFLQGFLGEPLGGFPEPLRSKVLAKAGKTPVAGRPGKDLPSLDLGALKASLEAKYEGLKREGLGITDGDVLSAALYPQVFAEYQSFRERFGNVAKLPTREFITPMKPGESVVVDIEEGKSLAIKLMQVAPQCDSKGMRSVFFELNGVPREVRIADKATTAKLTQSANPRAEKGNDSHAAASMPGTLIALLKKEGEAVAKGDVVAKLSAMKMETTISASKDGKVSKVYPRVGDVMRAGDLVMVIE